METQTQTTVQVNGREYSLEIDPAGDVFNPDRPHYTLTGKRGARYHSMRNQKTPDLMFLVSDSGAVASHGLRDVWLSDRGGQLRQVKLL